MNKNQKNNLPRKGFTLVEIIVAMAILLIAAAAFLPTFIYSSKGSNTANVRLMATNVATSEIEKINAMTYNEIGTVGGTPSGTIPQQQVIEYNGQSFTVNTTVNFKPATDSTNQIDSRAYKQINVTVLHSSYFSGDSKNYAEMILKVTSEGERVIVPFGDILVTVTQNDQPKSGFRVEVLQDGMLKFFDYTDSDGEKVFANLVEGDYIVGANCVSTGMMVIPNAVGGSGYETNWVSNLALVVTKWTTQPAVFAVNYPAKLLLTLFDGNGNQLDLEDYKVSLIPQSITGLAVSVSGDKVSDVEIWPEWGYNLKVFSESNVFNAFDLAAVNGDNPYDSDEWDGTFNPTYNGAQSVIKGLTVKSAQPTIWTAAGRERVAAPIASLIEASVGTHINLTSAPSETKIMYSTDGSEPPSNTYDSANSPQVPATTTQLAPFVIKAQTRTPPSGTSSLDRILMDSDLATFNFFATGTATDAFSITLTSATNGAAIYYTTNGSTPSSASSLFTEPILIDRPTTVKTIAYKDGITDSEVATYVYTMQSAVPVPDPPDGVYAPGSKISLSCPTTGVQIYYTTDGSDPVLYGILWDDTKTIQATPGLVIKCYAARTNWAASEVATYTYQLMNQIPLPQASLASGTYYGAQTVSLSSTQSGAIIYYTTDGSTPTIYSAVYSSPLVLNGNCVLKFFAVKNGMIASNVSTYTYTIFPTIAAPIASPGSGYYTTAQTVTLTCTTPGVTIRYTTDGTDPTTTSTAYSSPINISSTTVLRAKAFVSGILPSQVAIFEYSYTQKLANPVANPSPGTYRDKTYGTGRNNWRGLQVTLSCPSSTTGVKYKYRFNDWGSWMVYDEAAGIQLKSHGTYTIHVYAYKQNDPYWLNSDEVTFTYTLTH